MLELTYEVASNFFPFFLSAFTTLQKATVNFVMFVFPSVRPHRTLLLPLEGFSLNLISDYFSKICRENSKFMNPLNAELNPICHLLALLEAHLIFHVSRIRVKIWQE